MTALGLLPRSSSNSNIYISDSSTGTWQQFNPSPGFKKPIIKGPTPVDSGICSRLSRTVTSRRAGMLTAVLVSLFCFLTLINFASRLSVHFNPSSGLDVINTFRIENNEVLGTELEHEAGSKAMDILNSVNRSRSDSRNSGSQGDEDEYQQAAIIGNVKSLETEVPNTRAMTVDLRSLPEDVVSEVHVVPKKINLSSLKNHSNLPRSLLSSDQPLPPNHPCHGFTLPPPPADKKRTGPRACPVCYLPLKKAILKMPVESIPRGSILAAITYKVEPTDDLPQEFLQASRFGGHPSLLERNNSFQVQKHMNIHCGFVSGRKPGVGTGFDIDIKDLADMDDCTGIVVASAIFGNYDVLQQPKYISPYSRSTVCFYMFVDEETQQSLSEFNMSGTGIWKVVVVRNMPYVDARRNGKIPKLLLHRLFPNARYSLWIDGKLRLVVDPYQVLERFLWRQNKTFAISQHYKRLDVFEEAEANKAAGKYDNASINAQIDFYHAEGITKFDRFNSPFRSDVPEGCVIIREHTPISNLFTCLWFNEVDRFTSRDQLSFAIVRNRLMANIFGELNMFLDCERRNFVLQAYHRGVLEQKHFLLQSSSGQNIETSKPSLRLTPMASSKEGTMVLSHARHFPTSKKSRKRRRRTIP